MGEPGGLPNKEESLDPVSVFSLVYVIATIWILWMTLMDL